MTYSPNAPGFAGGKTIGQVLLRKIRKLLFYISVTRKSRQAISHIKQTKAFDRKHYFKTNPTLNLLYRISPERHYVLFGEALGLTPNSAFDAHAYRMNTPDLPPDDCAFLDHLERAATAPKLPNISNVVDAIPVIHPHQPTAPYAIVVHVFYHDLWGEISKTLQAADIPFDLLVTITDFGAPTDPVCADILRDFPKAQLYRMPNHGRDIFPFVHLANSGALNRYQAICKLHTKKSPHLTNGNAWRKSLVDGILPKAHLGENLQEFLQDFKALIWVSDKNCLSGNNWWMANRATTTRLLRRGGFAQVQSKLRFPSGSIYWVKPQMIAMIKKLRLQALDFPPEQGQLDGTTAHAFERAIGVMAQSAGTCIRETHQLRQVMPPTQGRTTRRATNNSTKNRPSFSVD